MGIDSPYECDSQGTYEPHPEDDKHRPLTFQSANGFVFGDGVVSGNPIMTVPTILQTGADMNYITTPGYYHIENNVIANSIANLPELVNGTKYSTAGIIKVEQISILRECNVYKFIAVLQL